MAYSLSERFPPSPIPYALLDPGSYQYEQSTKPKIYKAPFLSNAKRETQAGRKIWTHAIYDSNIPSNIPNCSSMMSKRPRFPYEAFSQEDLEEMLCRCGIDNVCECSSETKENVEIICQGKVKRRLYIGHPPRSMMGDGLSAPSKRDQGFDIGTDGSRKRLMKKKPVDSPPFYDCRVNESTAFYQGCKWSKWTSTRASKATQQMSGPADYTIETKPTPEQICAERVREDRRKHSKQLRFIEMVQQRNILEGRPGPADYNVQGPKGTQMSYLGPKAKRFQESSEISPGPADHWVKRAFDRPEPPLFPCHAKLPEPSFFGVKAQRFKTRKEEGPSPASYSPNDKFCNIMNCSKAPFGSTAVRFKPDPIDEDDEDEIIVSADQPIGDKTEELVNECPAPTWEFKSKTIRIKPLVKKYNEPSPADLPQSRIKVRRSPLLQYLAPFYSSEGRMTPWNDWMPVFGKLKTPGPCYYNLEKPRCIPAVTRGPLVRTARFPHPSFLTPAPNEYNVGGGLETVLETHNVKLKGNIDKQHKFHWNPPIEAESLSPHEREAILLQKSIQLLEGGLFDSPSSGEKQKLDIDKNIKSENKTKLLRCFLYRHKMKPTY